jgi:hypothetical protein
MTKSGDTQPEARFESPLHLWIAIWQRQLVERSPVLYRPTGRA